MASWWATNVKMAIDKLEAQKPIDFELGSLCSLSCYGGSFIRVNKDHTKATQEFGTDGIMAPFSSTAEQVSKFLHGLHSYLEEKAAQNKN